VTDTSTEAATEINAGVILETSVEKGAEAGSGKLAGTGEKEFTETGVETET
jgi:hypothetical protein